jgi:hypothetical protein
MGTVVRLGLDPLNSTGRLTPAWSCTDALIWILPALIGTHNLCDQAIIWVRHGQQQRDALECSIDAQAGLPGALGRHVEDVKAYAALGIDVGVVDGGDEGDLWGLKGISAA